MSQVREIPERVVFHSLCPSSLLPPPPPMVLWIFGYGSLIWKAGFEYDRRVTGYVRNYSRLFLQGSTDHRGTPEAPGRTVTLEYCENAITWGAAYSIEGGVDAEQTAISYLEVREKQYDVRLYADLYTKDSGSEPAIKSVLIYVGSSDSQRNPNYLGWAPTDSIARQIAHARGPSGPNAEYLFRLEEALKEIGVEDEHVTDIANQVRAIIGVDSLQNGDK